MKRKINVVLAIGTLIIISACGSSSKIAIVPLSSHTEYEDTYTIIWNGKSEAYLYIDGQYVRNEPYDYVFNVTQKRYDNIWKSTKTLHRNHPEYDFRGGPRSQTMYFEIAYSSSSDGLSTVLKTSLGDGSGSSDLEFREQSLIIDLNQNNSYYNIGKFTPFNKMKITQHYMYEDGKLMETVELYKEENGVITPFAKMEEMATFYVRGKLDKAPTTFKK